MFYRVFAITQKLWCITTPSLWINPDNYFFLLFLFRHSAAAERTAEMARLSRRHPKLDRGGDPGLLPQEGRAGTRVLETARQARQTARAQAQERAATKVSAQVSNVSYFP